MQDKDLDILLSRARAAEAQQVVPADLAARIITQATACAQYRSLTKQPETKVLVFRIRTVSLALSRWLAGGLGLATAAVAGFYLGFAQMESTSSIVLPQDILVLDAEGLLFDLPQFEAFYTENSAEWMMEEQ